MMREAATPETSISEPGEVPATQGAHRGSRVALGVVGLLLLGLGGIISSRLHAAKDKQASLVTERAAAQVAAVQRLPSLSARPTPVAWRPRIDVTGTLRPWREAEIGFELSGRLVQVGVAQGDRVRSGTVLGVLDGSRAAAEVNAAQAQARAAQANLEIAEDTLRRTHALVATGSVPEAQETQAREQVALLRAQLEGAQANAEVARTGQGLHTIVAPFEGVVTKAPTAAGSVVQPGTALFRIEDLSKLRLSASLGEEEASLVKVGAPVTVAYRDRKVSGKLITLVPSLDQATRRAPIEVSVPNDPTNPILAYGFVHALIEGAREIDALRLPATARRPGSQDEVVKVVDGKAVLAHVPHLTDEDGSWIALGGVAAADVLVLNPPDDVRDGDPIELAKAAPAPAAPAP
jgi:RND family efflux transporter MFP subunit